MTPAATSTDRTAPRHPVPPFDDGPWIDPRGLVTCVIAAILGFAFASNACAEDGIRETWIACPPEHEFQRVAGEYGFVIVRDPVRENIVLKKLEDCAARDETCAAAEKALDRADALIEVGERERDELRLDLGACHDHEISLVRENAVLNVKATRPRGRWKAFLFGAIAGVIAVEAVK